MSLRRASLIRDAFRLAGELIALAWSLANWLCTLLIVSLAIVGLLFLELLREAREPLADVASSTLEAIAGLQPEIVDTGLACGFAILLLAEVLSLCARGRAAVGIRIPPRWGAVLGVANAIFHHR